MGPQGGIGVWSKSQAGIEALAVLGRRFSGQKKREQEAVQTIDRIERAQGDCDIKPAKSSDKHHMMKMRASKGDSVATPQIARMIRAHCDTSKEFPAIGPIVAMTNEVALFVSAFPRPGAFAKAQAIFYNDIVGTL